MCRYNGNQLNDVEQSLRKIKALADLMIFSEESDSCFPMESLKGLGYCLAGLAQEALAIFKDDGAPVPAFNPSEALASPETH